MPMPSLPGCLGEAPYRARGPAGTGGSDSRALWAAWTARVGDPDAPVARRSSPLASSPPRTDGKALGSAQRHPPEATRPSPCSRDGAGGAKAHSPLLSGVFGSDRGRDLLVGVARGRGSEDACELGRTGRFLPRGAGRTRPFGRTRRNCPRVSAQRSLPPPGRTAPGKSRAAAPPFENFITEVPSPKRQYPRNRESCGSWPKRSRSPPPRADFARSKRRGRGPSGTSSRQRRGRRAGAQSSPNMRAVSAARVSGLVATTPRSLRSSTSPLEASRNSLRPSGLSGRPWSSGHWTKSRERAGACRTRTQRRVLKGPLQSSSRSTRVKISRACCCRSCRGPSFTIM